MSDAIPHYPTLSHQAQEIYNRYALARDTCKSRGVCIGCSILDVCATDDVNYQILTDAEIEEMARRLLHEDTKS